MFSKPQFLVLSRLRELMGVQTVSGKWERKRGDSFCPGPSFVLKPPQELLPPPHPRITPSPPPLPVAQMGLGDSDVGARHRVCSSVGFRWLPPPQPCLLRTAGTLGLRFNEGERGMGLRWEILGVLRKSCGAEMKG